MPLIFPGGSFPVVPLARRMGAEGFFFETGAAALLAGPPETSTFFASEAAASLTFFCFFAPTVFFRCNRAMNLPHAPSRNVSESKVTFRCFGT